MSSDRPASPDAAPDSRGFFVRDGQPMHDLVHRADNEAFIKANLPVTPSAAAAPDSRPAGVIRELSCSFCGPIPIDLPHDCPQDAPRAGGPGVGLPEEVEGALFWLRGAYDSEANERIQLIEDHLHHLSAEVERAKRQARIEALEWARKNCPACGGHEIGIPTGGGDWDECNFCVKIDAEIQRLQAAPGGLAL